MLRVYDSPLSGNCYKVRLLMSQLDIPHQVMEIDIFKGETRTPGFLAKNPDGRVPLLELDSGEFLPESNAILVYLSEGTALLPAERLLRARVLQWMFFEQQSIEPYIGSCRFWISLLGKEEEYKQKITENQNRGYAALTTMETHLVSHSFFVDKRYTVADIALYAYTHVAHEGGFNLESFPAVRAWLERVGSQPGHIPFAPAPRRGDGPEPLGRSAALNET